jgi:hypothetical protein
MSNDSVTAVGWVSSDPMERYRAAQQHTHLASFDPSANGAHLSVTAPMAVEPTTSSLNVRNVFAAAQFGLNEGFVTPSLERIRGMIENPVSPGQMQTALLDAHLNLALTETLSKISSKTAEALQTLVVKQG